MFLKIKYKKYVKEYDRINNHDLTWLISFEKYKQEITKHKGYKIIPNKRGHSFQPKLSLIYILKYIQKMTLQKLLFNIGSFLIDLSEEIKYRNQRNEFTKGMWKYDDETIKKIQDIKKLHPEVKI